MATACTVYSSPAAALSATDEFYMHQDGFQYTEQRATKWIQEQLALPKKGRVLDLCCGDGIWTKGMKNVNPGLEYFGIDISSGAIHQAQTLLETDDSHFVVGDAEGALPFADDFFDLIFARGPGLYNQHSMDRDATIRVIESWHSKLHTGGRFYSIFASRPDKMGTYTSMEDARLPYNRCPRTTEAVDFLGGKYHHSIESFMTPFWKGQNVEIVRYSFIQNMHVLITKLKDA